MSERLTDHYTQQGLAEKIRAGVAEVTGGQRDVTIDDLATGQVSPSEDQRNRDRSQLLVATALVVGSDRAIAAAHRHLSDEQLAAVVPLIQTHAFSADLQRSIKDQKLKLSDLREQVTADITVEPEELVQLQRVSWQSLGMAAAILLAAYALISALADLRHLPADELVSRRRQRVAGVGVYKEG